MEAHEKFCRFKSSSHPQISYLYRDQNQKNDVSLGKTIKKTTKQTDIQAKPLLYFSPSKGLLPP